MENERSKGGGKGYLGAVLVVVALVVLFAVFYPTFAKARKAAKKPACLSNLKRIGTAINMYMGDWDDKFPLVSGFGADLDQHKALWGTDGSAFNPRGKERKYMADLFRPDLSRRDDEKALFCPSIGRDGVWHVPDGTVDFGRNGTTYIFNAWCIKNATSTPPADCVTITGESKAICKSPADAPLVWDGRSGYALPSGSAHAQIAHHDVINVLHFDGHVRSVQLPEDKPPWNGTEGRTCHFWGAPNPDSGTTYGATGWF